MPEDRSLDEFAADPTDGAERDDTGRDPAAETGATDVDADANDADANDADANDTVAADTDGETPASNAGSAAAALAVPTATWTTDGAACDRCGESVSRRWFDDDALVCADCKEW